MTHNTNHVHDDNRHHVVHPQKQEPSHGVVANAAEQYIKNPPNNLNLAHPEQQSRASDLLGTEGTEVARGPQTAEEKIRIDAVQQAIEK